MTTPRRAVYTALLGGYEDLLEQPVAKTSNISFICFTDDATLTSDTWEIRTVEPSFPLDLVRSARTLKIVGHESLSQFDETLWVDNTVRLLADPNEILDEWLASADLAVSGHSYRRHLADEFDMVIRQGLDEPNRVLEQLTHYEATVPDVLGGGVLWTALLARRHGAKVDQVMRQWLDHVLRYSRRDQLSLPVVLAAHPIACEVVDIENHLSRWHEWPVASGRKKASVPTRLIAAVPSPFVLKVGELSNQLDEVSWQLNHAVKVRENEIAVLNDRIAVAEGELARVLGSASWGTTAPLRWMLEGARRAARRVKSLRN